MSQSDITTDFVSWLKLQTDLAAVIGDRIEPLQLTDMQVLPAVTYQQVGGQTKTITHDKRRVARRPSIQVQAWSSLYDEARAVVLMISDMVDGFSAQMGDSAVWRAEASEPIDQLDSTTGLFWSTITISFVIGG